MASFQVIPKLSVRHFSRSARLLRKPNIQRPIVPGTERRLLDAVTVPVYPVASTPLPIKCWEDLKVREERKRSELSEAYKAFRLKQAVKVFEESKLIAICHVLPMSPKDSLEIRTKLRAVGFQLVYMRNDIAVKATENSKLRHLHPFFTSTNAFIVCQEPKVIELVKVLKKISELLLIGGVVDDRIVSKDTMQEIARLPPLDTLRGELLTILNASASKTSRLLGSHQQELSRCLDQLANPTPPEESVQSEGGDER